MFFCDHLYIANYWIHRNYLCILFYKKLNDWCKIKILHVFPIYPSFVTSKKNLRYTVYSSIIIDLQAPIYISAPPPPQKKEREKNGWLHWSSHVINKKFKLSWKSYFQCMNEYTHILCKPCMPENVWGSMINESVQVYIPPRFRWMIQVHD